MIFHLSNSSGVPVYQQLMHQIRHGVDTGALRAGDKLPTIRKLAEDLVINPNTVIRAYRELQHEGVVEIRHGSGAYVGHSVSDRGRLMHKAIRLIGPVIQRLRGLGLSEDEIRRIIENQLLVVPNKNQETESA